jgi:hypothetical protein
MANVLSPPADFEQSHIRYEITGGARKVTGRLALGHSAPVVVPLRGRSADLTVSGSPAFKLLDGRMVTALLADVHVGDCP